MSCSPLDLGRFYEAPPWRLIVTNLDSETITWLDRLATDIVITRNFLAPSSISGRVPSDNPQVNILYDGPSTWYDGEPFLEEGTRLIYAFRRDCDLVGSMQIEPWVIRAAGIVLSTDDSGDQDAPGTLFTAWDPWEHLRYRPVRLSNGDIPREEAIADQVTYEAGLTAAEIILDQLTITESEDTLQALPGMHLDIGSGTIEPTEPLTEDYIVQRGKSIGQLIDDLVATGTVEPVFEPIYDPINRPGITHVLHIYAQAGNYRPGAIFGWDLWPKSLAGINRVRDGRQRQNRIQYFAGQGGPPVPMHQNGDSLTKFGEYFAAQFFPGQEALDIAEMLAERTLALQANGLHTYQLSPSAARAPVPLLDYLPGDQVPVYASNNLRAPVSGVPLRVQSIPLVIGEDQLERVNGLLVSEEPTLDLPIEV